MRKPKIYLETTMFNYYFDTERDAHPATVKLFQEIKAGKYEAYTSLYVTDELGEAQEPKRSNMVALIKKYGIIVLDYSSKAQELSELYTNEGVIPKSKKLDSLHISVATVNNLQYIFSFNFRHINRTKTKEMTSIINLREGYRPITIATPAEVIGND
ncbi:MAG: hypothetical protein FWG63_08190 [Defluviitaleaceae bacterium]|nr:hypothetical protein [Defluviitaleaceae bacterium]